MSMNDTDDPPRLERVEATAAHLSQAVASARSVGDLARGHRRTSGSYPIHGLVTSVPLKPDLEHAEEFEAYAKYINALRLAGKLGDGYVLATARGEKSRQEVWHSASKSSDAEVEEVRRVRNMPARVRRRGFERLAAYCASGCELVVVYGTRDALLVYVGGTTIVGGAGATLQAVRCSHQGYVFPSLRHVLALTSRNGPRRAVDMSTLSQRSRTW